MTKEAWIALIIFVIGLMVGIGTTYTVLKVDDAILKERVSTVISCSKQNQKDINYTMIEMSKIRTEIKSADESYKSLQKVIKEMSKSNRDLAIAITRLDERQNSFEGFIKQYLLNR